MALCWRTFSPIFNVFINRKYNHEIGKRHNLFQVSRFNKGNLVHYISQPIWILEESFQDNNAPIFTHIKCI